MRVLFLGMSAPFSRIVLNRLLSAGVDIAAVLLAGSRFRPWSQAMGLASAQAEPGGAPIELPIVNPYVPPGVRDQTYGGNVSDSAGPTKAMTGGRSTSAFPMEKLAQIEVFECGDIGHQEVVEFMADLTLDIACVACWHHVIPSGVLEVPRHGFLNVHPSLLPAYRGPQPLFWQFRAGETCTGVTVHWMDSGLDTGDIAAQELVHFADGIRLSDAEALCASAGGRILAEALGTLGQGQLERRPQQSGSYFPNPSAVDFAVDIEWPVRRAYNFVRAVAEWGYPFQIVVDGERQWFGDAIAWHDSEVSVPKVDGCVGVQFRDGVLWAQECPGPTR